MAKRLWTILKEYKPDHLIIEDTQQQNNVKTVIILARLQGMIIGYAEAHKVKVHILLPSQWRAELNYKQGPKVKRAELKQQSVDYVKDKYDVTLSEDECESICINQAAHKMFSWVEDDLWGE
jgi:Holliday junction resolvasome RuvABC endonuclease subunit